MTWLGIAYLVIGMLALITALGHTVQAAFIPTDPTPRAVAFASLGFFLYSLGYAFTRGLPGGADPLLGLAGTGAGFTLIVAFVPLTGWTLLDLPLTRTRALLIGVFVCVALGRSADVILHLSSDAERTVFALPAAVVAVAVSVVWTGDSVRAVRRGTPYARAMAGFGFVAIAATVQGLLVAAGLVAGPDSVGFGGVPFIFFVNTLTTLRYVHALKTANAQQPAGDMSRYQVLAPLGSGGMGDVFLARRRGPAGFLRDVVLKTLKSSATDATAAARFLSEARLAAQLRHPNIVDVYDLGEQPGGFFIVMERIEGPTLSDVLQQSAALGRPVPPEVVAELGVQLCRALGFAHGSQVIHRDLKPQNIMLTRTGVAKLIDFGIATTTGTDDITKEAGVVGTHGFIAPERLQGASASAASDLFSLGVVLYLLLAQQYPYAQPGSLDFIVAVRDRTAPRLGELRPDCPPQLRDAIEQCLDFDVHARPQSAAALEAALERSVHGTRVDLAAFVASLFPRGGEGPKAATPATPAPHDRTTAAARVRA